MATSITRPIHCFMAALPQFFASFGEVYPLRRDFSG